MFHGLHYSGHLDKVVAYCVLSQLLKDFVASCSAEISPRQFLETYLPRAILAYVSPTNYRTNSQYTDNPKDILTEVKFKMEMTMK
jgi:hypothetical protein